MQKSPSKRTLFIGLFAGCILFLIIFVATSIGIGNSVKKKCMLAQGRYGGDCVEALSTHLEDDNATFGKRNSAIWALGQLGDPRALPVLEKHYTGEIPDREPWDETVSQYELKKAVKLARGGLNLTHFVWHYNLP